MNWLMHMLERHLFCHWAELASGVQHLSVLHHCAAQHRLWGRACLAGQVSRGPRDTPPDGRSALPLRMGWPRGTNVTCLVSLNAQHAHRLALGRLGWRGHLLDFHDWCGYQAAGGARQRQSVHELLCMVRDPVPSGRAANADFTASSSAGCASAGSSASPSSWPTFSWPWDGCVIPGCRCPFAVRQRELCGPSTAQPLVQPLPTCVWYQALTMVEAFCCCLRRSWLPRAFSCRSM
jgi:hypothetical protein